VDASDVSRVTNYVVSYACKGTETVVEEKKEMASITRAAMEEDGDVRDVKRLARKLLNQCTKNRVLSKQEAVCQLTGLSLWDCSERMETVSLSGNTRLGTEFAGKKTFLAKYANRDYDLYKNMSLNQYFDHTYNNLSTKNGDKNIKIPIYSGARCEAVFPATAAYARGVMLIYSPWHGTFNLDGNNAVLLETFNAFVADKTKCPESVSVAYERARISYGMKEPTTKGIDVVYDNFTVSPDQDMADLVDLASTLYKNMEEEIDVHGMKYDYGNDFNWSEREIEVSHTDLSF
jgi:hypothetical protein